MWSHHQTTTYHVIYKETIMWSYLNSPYYLMSLLLRCKWDTNTRNWFKLSTCFGLCMMILTFTPVVPHRHPSSLFFYRYTKWRTFVQRTRYRYMIKPIIAYVSIQYLPICTTSTWRIPWKHWHVRRHRLSRTLALKACALPVGRDFSCFSLYLCPLCMS